LTADKPKYATLIAISSITSPLKQILESIREETALTRERPAQGESAASTKAGSAQPNPPPALFKSQDRAPGAAIEAACRPSPLAVEGDAMRRPGDEGVANLREISQNLVLSATNREQRSQANTVLQNQVAGLRANAARLPPPFSDMLRNAVGEFEGDVAA